jgi:hypothetical protein
MWRNDAIAAAVRVLQGKGRAPSYALETALQLLDAIYVRFGPMGLLLLPRGDEAVDLEYATAPVSLLGAFIRVEVFGFLQKISLQHEQDEEQPGVTDSTQEDAEVFFLCLSLCEALQALLAGLLEVLDGGQPVMAGGGRCNQETLCVVEAVALSEDFKMSVCYALALSRQCLDSSCLSH